LHGEIVVIDTYNNLIRIVDERGGTRRIGGQVLAYDDYGFPRGAHRDGAAASARFNRPTGAAFDAAGRLFIADSENHLIRVMAGGNVFTHAGSLQPGHHDAHADFALFNTPTALAFDPSGNLFITDTLNHVIRMIDTQGYVTTIAGVPGRFGYFCEDENTALFNSPAGIAVCPGGRVFVADTGNHLIRMIHNGDVSTFAGTLLFPDSIEWDDFEEGDFFETEPLGGYQNGYEAMFNLPVGLAFWNDILLVADSANHVIRAVFENGYTATLAGTGYADYTHGAPGEAEFHFSRDIHVRGRNLYIADTGNNLIRTMTLSAPPRLYIDPEAQASNTASLVVTYENETWINLRGIVEEIGHSVYTARADYGARIVEFTINHAEGSSSILIAGGYPDVSITTVVNGTAKNIALRRFAGSWYVEYNDFYTLFGYLPIIGGV
jgi:hypothetical protein